MRIAIVGDLAGTGTALKKALEPAYEVTLIKGPGLKFLAHIPLFWTYDLVIASCLSPLYTRPFVPRKKMLSLAHGSDVREYMRQEHLFARLLRWAHKTSGFSMVVTPDLLAWMEDLGIYSIPFPNVVEPQVIDRKPNLKHAVLCPTFVGAQPIKRLWEYTWAAEVNDPKKTLENFHCNVSKVPKDELLSSYSKYDAIADQFGGIGLSLTALEALARGKQVITCMPHDAERFYQGDIPPILAAQNANEILGHVRSIGRGKVPRFNEEGPAWVERQHGAEAVRRRILLIYAVANDLDPWNEGLL